MPKLLASTWSTVQLLFVNDRTVYATYFAVAVLRLLSPTTNTNSIYFVQI